MSPPSACRSTLVALAKQVHHACSHGLTVSVLPFSLRIWGPYLFQFFKNATFPKGSLTIVSVREVVALFIPQSFLS